MKFGTRFEHDKIPGLVCKSESHVKQSFAAEVNINAIMARYNRTGVFPAGQGFIEARFGDVSELTSYEDGLELVQRVDSAFADLPAVVRSRFDNDPVRLLQFLQDGKNRSEAVKLGLLVEPSAVPTPAVEKSEVKQ